MRRLLLGDCRRRSDDGEAGMQRAIGIVSVVVIGIEVVIDRELGLAEVDVFQKVGAELAEGLFR
jgi:hypothetical protein